MEDASLSGMRMLDRCRLRVTGKVQGVWFRAWTSARACELGLRGWVRNLPDGSVELEAEGIRGSLVRLRDGVAQGPPHASVAGVEDLEVSAEPLPDPFEIR